MVAGQCRRTGERALHSDVSRFQVAQPLEAGYALQYLHEAFPGGHLVDVQHGSAIFGIGEPEAKEWLSLAARPALLEHDFDEGWQRIA